MRKVGDKDSRGKNRVQTVNTKPSLTVQSDAHLADITNIMKKFGAEGIEMLDEAKLVYADVSQFTDLRDALDQAREAEIKFLRLPSKVREIFNHDVAEWLDTAHDQEKRDALVAAGFLKDPDTVVAQAGVAGTPTPPEGTPLEGPNDPPPPSEEGSA